MSVITWGYGLWEEHHRGKVFSSHQRVYVVTVLWLRWHYCDKMNLNICSPGLRVGEAWWKGREAAGGCIHGQETGEEHGTQFLPSFLFNLRPQPMG